MIDHFASKLEENETLILNTKSLEKEFGGSFDLEKKVKEKTKLTNKKYRKLFHLEILNFFKSSKLLLALIILYAIEYQLFNVLSAINFKRFNIILFTIPVFLCLAYYLFYYLKKNKSIHILYSTFYLSLPFLLVNFFISIQTNDILFMSKETKAIILLVAIPIYFMMSYCSYKVHRKTHRFYTDLHAQLRSI